MKHIPEELLLFLNKYSHYIIASHKEPDGDSVGSSRAMDHFLRSKGKTTTLLSAGPFKRPELHGMEHYFAQRIDPASLSADTGVLVLDCSNIERVGDAAEGITHLDRVVIDHHATNSAEGPADYIDSHAPSTTVLVQAIIEHVNGAVSAEEADCLLFGLCTDTGYFRHLDKSQGEAFHCAGRLAEAGADPKKTYSRITGGKSFGSRILISRILGRMQSYYDGALIISWETLAETAEFGMEGRDSDSLYQLIQSISGVEAIVVIRQETETNCTVGFRSRDKIDVSQVASSFGGGGHRQASGLSIAGTIEELLPRLVEAFAPQFAALDV